MTIRPGEEWGHHGALPPGAPVVETDAAAAQLVADWLHGGGPPGELVVGIAGGDLHRTIGAPAAERMRTDAAMWLPCDVGRAVIDGIERYFVAHLTAGRGVWFRGRTAVVMNAAFIGPANLGPKAHPGDGRLDVTIGSLGWRDRLSARSRYGAGSHLPHPQLATSRVAAIDLRFEGPVRVRLDGVDAGRAREIAVEVVPDAFVAVA